MKTALGVWLDSNRALIVHDITGDVHVTHIDSDVVKKTHATGGHHRPQGYSHDSTVNHLGPERRRRHRLEIFFENIASQIDDVDELYVVGPGLTKKSFLRYLAEHNQARQAEVLVKTCGSHLTENQIKALMRDMGTPH